ncbi:MAG: hypothetical protein M0C28_23190 [Candidatus Moduliflexus flocculans]|nr:hypothetical protein [Candidatus Moduliflexus flocculans]
MSRASLFAEARRTCAPQGAAPEARRRKRRLRVCMARGHDRAAACSIVGYLVVRGLAVAQLEFLLDVPRQRHDATAASGRRFVGTHLPGRASRSRSPRPIGVLAAVYLNEYAQGQLVQPRHQPRGDQPGRRAEHRARAVRPGRVRLRRAVRLLDPLRLAHAGDHDAAGDHRQHARGAGRRCRWPSARPAGTSARRAGRRSGASCCPNSISGILTGVILQVSRAAGRDGADHVHRARSSSRPSSGATSSPTASTTSAWRSPCTSTRSPPRCRT